jgi:ribosomal protein S18 acetylase RimI-like enzyme
MRIWKRDLKVVSIHDGFERIFWDHINRDPFDYYFFILDLKERKEQTKILLAIDGNKVEGLALVYEDRIVQFRGNRTAVKKLLEHVNLEKVELQAPFDCEDLILEKYEPQVRHELVIMTLNRGEETLQIRHDPVRLGLQDAERVAEIMRSADPSWWGDITAEDRKMSLEKTFWLGIMQDGKIVSVGNTRFVDFGSNIGIVATDANYRNRGYATTIVSALVQEILKKSPTALIHVLKTNAPAVRAYSKVGYKPYKHYLLLRGGMIKK